MKRNLKIILLIFFIIANLSACSFDLNHYEGKLYSDKKFTHDVDNRNEQKLNIFTRNKAIEKAIITFDKGFNIKIDRPKLTESIKLINYYGEYTYVWQINWLEDSTNESYNCIIDSSNGDIISISVLDQNRKREGNIYKITSDENINISTPLLTELKINTKDYEIKDSNNKDIFNKYYELQFSRINDSKQQFFIYIDGTNKKLVSYSRFKKYLY